MAQRLRVFLSSTATDLGEYRRIADDTLLRLQQQSVVMERFGALPGSAVDECERLAASADLVVCIVAHRYGYEPEQGRGSITRREVEAALRAGKPVYAWIVDEAHPWTEAREQDRMTQPEVLADPAKISDVAAAVRQLLAFKAWLRREVVTETFTTADDLGRKVGTALANVVPAQGVPSYPGRALAWKPELRIAHALQPAPHFNGREDLVRELSAWVDDAASPDSMRALVAAGGTGKTAIAERIVSRLRSRWPTEGTGNVLVWSFYERPDADAFLRECGQLLLGEDERSPPGGRLERLQRGLRDGRPHLFVLDGLERVQSDGGYGRARGELEDQTLRLLLQSVAAGLGRTRALVTSRFALSDMRAWLHRGVVETHLDDLPTAAARVVLRQWGVKGEDLALDELTAKVGGHALSVAVMGSYLSHFEGGRVEAALRFGLDDASGDDPKAAKLARVLAYYAERLPVDERAVLARLSVFPRGVSIAVLTLLVEPGGALAGPLVDSPSVLPRLLQRLADRGLVFRYTSNDGAPTWTAHPFIRESFARLLGHQAEAVFDVVAKQLGAGLEGRPESKPTDVATLDQYEQLIEMTRLAGRTQDAFDLYWFALEGYPHLGVTLGDHERGYRILRGFLPVDGEPEGFGQGLSERSKAFGLNQLALWAHRLGRLSEADSLLRACIKRLSQLHDHKAISVCLHNTSDLAYDRGRLMEARKAADQALIEASLADNKRALKNALADRGRAAHRAGDLWAAGADFAAARDLETETLLYSGRGQWHARHHLDRGDLAASKAIVDAGLRLAQQQGWNHEVPGWHALLARLALESDVDPSEHLDAIRHWTARTGDVAQIIEAHGIAALAALARGDVATAKGEAEDGIRQAKLCGYRLFEIEILVALSATNLAWPDANQALVAARQALDLATAADCQDPWGEVIAANAWGQAFEALGQFEHAQRARDQARIAHERIHAVRQLPASDQSRIATRRVTIEQDWANQPTVRDACLSLVDRLCEAPVMEYYTLASLHRLAVGIDQRTLARAALYLSTEKIGMLVPTLMENADGVWEPLPPTELEAHACGNALAPPTTGTHTPEDQLLVAFLPGPLLGKTLS